MKVCEMDKHQSVPYQLRQKLCDFLSKKLGLFCSLKEWSDLEKKISLAATAFGFEEKELFIEWLLKASLSANQVSLLAQYFTTGETYFFRNHLEFSVLEKNILPELIAARNKENKKFLRIWSAGCCTGEEPYSIAIMLQRLIPNWKDWDITLIGTDINLNFLQKARQGDYTKWSFRAIRPEIQKRYFIKDKEIYKLIPEIKKMVTFKYLNLADLNVDDMTGMDLIVCNNVLIYFSPDQIQKSIQKFSELLREGGWLLVTSIEAPFVNNPQLNLYKFNEITIFKKVNLLSPIQDKTTEMIYQKTPHSATIPLQEGLLKYGENQKYEQLLGLYQQKKYSDLIFALEKMLMPLKNAELKNRQEELLLLIRSYANQGNSLAGLKWCDRLLEIEKFNPLYHYLKATILQELNCLDGAINALKMALSLDADFVPAYFSLGNIELSAMHINVAAKYLKNALELLKTMQADKELVGMEGIRAGQLIEIIKANPYLSFNSK